MLNQNDKEREEELTPTDCIISDDFAFYPLYGCTGAR